MNVTKTDDDIRLCQPKYIKDLLYLVRLKYSKSTNILVVASTSISKADSVYLVNATQFHTIVDAFQYCTVTQLEINFIGNKLCQLLHQPTDKHWLAIKRLLIYLKSIRNNGIYLTSSNSIHIITYIEAD